MLHLHLDSLSAQALLQRHIGLHISALCLALCKTASFDTNEGTSKQSASLDQREALDMFLSV